MFTVYVDESGDAGISKVRNGAKPGASPYFVVGAVVCQPTSEVFVRNAIDEFRALIGKTSWKHATDLNHAEKVYLARELARELGRQPVRYFATISNKATLGQYKDLIHDDAHKFYNKCLLYLLEKICMYLSPHLTSADDLKVVLEKRNHDYDRLLRYLSKVKEKPIYPQSKALSLLNPFSISTMEKGSDQLLDVADFVSHAVYQITNLSRSNFGIPEPRYLLEIGSCFGSIRNSVYEAQPMQFRRVIY